MIEPTLEPTLNSVSRSVWWGWGDPAQAGSLSAAARGELTRRLRLRAVDNPPVALSAVHLATSRLDTIPQVRQELEEIVGVGHVHTDPLWRMEHAGGKSYVDLFRARSGDGSHAPDAVLEPQNEQQVARLMDWVAANDAVVVPFGGGTSVVGGVTVGESGDRLRVSLDLRGLAGLLELDETSLTARFGAGTRAADAERALRERGYTLGHFPQSYEQATIGGFVATRSAGQSSSGYGRIDDMVTAARIVTPVGTVTFGDRSPASAAGPALLDLVVGSEGAFGVITEATLRIRRAPSATRHAAYAFASFEAGSAALRELVQQLGHDAQPDVTRLSDPDETQVSLLLAGGAGRALGAYLSGRRMTQPCLLILLWHAGSDKQAAARAKLAAPILQRNSAVRLPAKVASAWEHGRFSAPYLRDELMTMGVFIETLETATTWSNLRHLYREVQAAISSTLDGQGNPGIVQCHISHVYHSGASLYFTFVAAEAADPLAQGAAVKQAASRAIMAAGGTITHHHAVGRDHQPYLREEIGEIGERILAAVKRELDPHGILNPGVLIQEETR